MTAPAAPAAHRRPLRPVDAVLVPAFLAAAALAWAWAHVWALLRTVVRLAARVLCWLLCTFPGQVTAYVGLPLAAALAVWLAWPDHAERDRDTGVHRMVQHGDVKPCRTTAGGRCTVHAPPPGPIGGDGG